MSVITVCVTLVLMNDHTAEAEEESLKLVYDIREALCSTLTALEGKPNPGYSFTYIYFLAGYLNRAADGFVLLRTNGRIDSSKLLIRPAIEAMFRLTAVLLKPDLFYRVAYGEHEEDLKWLRQASRHASTKFDENALVKQWSEFSAKYKAEFPQSSASCNRLSLEEAAINANMSGYYDAYYRMYCRYQHVALRAVGRTLDELTDAQDNRAIALCIFAALESLTALGAPSPSNFDSLRDRLKPPSTEPTAA